MAFTVLRYALNPPDAGNINNGSVITWSYDQATGTLAATSDGTELNDVNSYPVDVSGLPGP